MRVSIAQNENRSKAFPEFGMKENPLGVFPFLSRMMRLLLTDDMMQLLLRLLTSTFSKSSTTWMNLLYITKATWPLFADD
jgi:hypothetical protein